MPAICNGDLATNGYTEQPLTYKSDSVWSYEVGSKNRLLGGRLVLDGSLYEIKWKNIQTNVSLPNCSYNFVDNLADATSKGFDFAFQFKATEHLQLSGSVGYNDAKFDGDARSPGGVKIYNGGSSIPNAGPPMTVALAAEYVFPLAASRHGYVRADLTRTTEWRREGRTDPGTSHYDPLIQPIPAYDVLNLRAGARFGNFDVSLFINNVSDRAPSLELDHSSFYDPQDWQNISLRPRSYGLTLTWRQ